MNGINLFNMDCVILLKSFKTITSTTNYTDGMSYILMHDVCTTVTLIHEMLLHKHKRTYIYRGHHSHTHTGHTEYKIRYTLTGPSTARL